MGPALLPPAPAAYLARAPSLPTEELQAELEELVAHPDTLFQGAVLAVRVGNQPLRTGAAGGGVLTTPHPRYRKRRDGQRTALLERSV
jgi:hypothetical protein